MYKAKTRDGDERHLERESGQGQKGIHPSKIEKKKVKVGKNPKSRGEKGDTG